MSLCSGYIALYGWLFCGKKCTNRILKIGVHSTFASRQCKVIIPKVTFCFSNLGTPKNSKYSNCCSSIGVNVGVTEVSKWFSSCCRPKNVSCKCLGDINLLCAIHNNIILFLPAWWQWSCHLRCHQACPKIVSSMCLCFTFYIAIC